MLADLTPSIKTHKVILNLQSIIRRTPCVLREVSR